MFVASVAPIGRERTAAAALKTREIRSRPRARGGVRYTRINVYGIIVLSDGEDEKKKEIIIKIIPLREPRGSFHYSIFITCIRDETGPLLHHKHIYTVFGLMIRFYASAILGAALARVCDGARYVY